MVKRQPKGTPVGGQFAEGRKPEGNDLTTSSVNPGFGSRYGGAEHYLTDEGVTVTMWRKGQRVRFYDDEGNQVGPEQSNVAPAVAYIHANGWQSELDYTVVKAREVKKGEYILLHGTICEVMDEAEIEAEEDIFGQKLDRLRLRRTDTDEVGTMPFGSQGIVRSLPSMTRTD